MNVHLHLMRMNYWSLKRNATCEGNLLMVRRLLESHPIELVQY